MHQCLHFKIAIKTLVSNEIQSHRISNQQQIRIATCELNFDPPHLARQKLTCEGNLQRCIYPHLMQNQGETN